jgi:hypothetical protein
MKATKPPVRNRHDTQEDSFYWALTGDSLWNPRDGGGQFHHLTIPWISEAVAGAGTTMSAPATTYNPIGNLVTAAGPGDSLLFYWQHSESGPFNPEQVAPPGSIA